MTLHFCWVAQTQVAVHPHKQSTNGAWHSPSSATSYDAQSATTRAVCEICFFCKSLWIYTALGGADFLPALGCKERASKNSELRSTLHSEIAASFKLSTSQDLKYMLLECQERNAVLATHALASVLEDVSFLFITSAFHACVHSLIFVMGNHC